MFEFVTETGSTNADLAARLRAGEPLSEGTWLIADRQIDGKGRQGRDWIGGDGNFMGSTVVNLTGQEVNPSCLAMVAGLAVYETVLVRLPLPAKLELKWPNDLLLAGGKLAGILLERSGDAVIVGIGVNLAESPRLARQQGNLARPVWRHRPTAISLPQTSPRISRMKSTAGGRAVSRPCLHAGLRRHIPRARRSLFIQVKPHRYRGLSPVSRQTGH